MDATVSMDTKFCFEKQLESQNRPNSDFETGSFISDILVGLHFKDQEGDEEGGFTVGMLPSRWSLTRKVYDLDFLFETWITAFSF